MIKSTYFLLLPSFGILLFMLLYAVAAAYYPGGSKANQVATSFSWRHNYWCDLFDVTTYNGSKNPSRNIAIGA